jgi:quercetin dioxygenase-like cupin family protein
VGRRGYPPEFRCKVLNLVAAVTSTRDAGVRPEFAGTASPRPNPEVQARVEAFIIEQYAAGRSLRQLAELTDRSFSAVRNILNRRGVHRRGAGAATGRRRVAHRHQKGSAMTIDAVTESQPRDALAATLTRTEIQRSDCSIPGREIVQVRTEIPVGVASGWHTHPGEEVGYIVAGTVQMEIHGRATLTLHAGDGFLIPPGTPHNATDLGPGTGQMLSTFTA